MAMVTIAAHPHVVWLCDTGRVCGVRCCLLSLAAPPKPPMAFAARITNVDDLEAMRLRLSDMAAQLPTGLQSLSPEQPLEAVLAALWRDGSVILKNAVSGECADRVVAEMNPFF